MATNISNIDELKGMVDELSSYAKTLDDTLSNFNSMGSSVSDYDGIPISAAYQTISSDLTSLNEGLYNSVSNLKGFVDNLSLLDTDDFDDVSIALSSNTSSNSTDNLILPNGVSFTSSPTDTNKDNVDNTDNSNLILPSSTFDSSVTPEIERENFENTNVDSNEFNNLILPNLESTSPITPKVKESTPEKVNVDNTGVSNLILPNNVQYDDDSSDLSPDGIVDNEYSKVTIEPKVTISGPINVDTSRYVGHVNSANDFVIESGNPDVDVSHYSSNPEKGFQVTTGNLAYNMSEEDVSLLCAIVNAESDNSYDDALAVMTTILNRCETSNWIQALGKDPVSQATAYNQFVVYQEGAYKRFLGFNCAPEVQTAVRDALSGVRNHGYCSFRSNGSTGYSDNMISPTGNRYK